MLERAVETAYFFNSRLPLLALVGKGVRFPPGQWIRIAPGTAQPWRVEELVPDLFPGLRGRPLPMQVLLTDFDVDEFERELEQRAHE
ncbi:MAG TPA: hypothetical protein VFL36_07000 [Myxococcales bacterium]|nr:hypothetical protein [Myxococcales bacterium]